jgi:hypothetical protein
MIAIVLMVCFAAWCFAQAVRLSGGGQRAKVCPEWDVCPERAVVREKVEIPEEASEPVARPVVMPAVVSPVPVRPAPPVRSASHSARIPTRRSPPQPGRGQTIAGHRRTSSA